MSTKAEKQLIDAKIAKVREVIRNVSNNDIVLALHSYDMDVNRTIQALTTDIESALGAWTSKGSTGKKGKQKKNNKTAAPVVSTDSAATSTTTETPKLSSVSSRPLTAPTTNLVSQQAHSIVTQSTKNIDPTAAKVFAPLSDGGKCTDLDALLHELDIKSAQIHKNIDNAYAEQAAVISAIQAALNNRDRQLFAHLESTRQQIESKVQQQRSTIQKLKQNPNVDEFARIKADQASLDSFLATNFTVHGDKAIKAIEKLGSGFSPPSTEAASYSAPATYQQTNGSVSQSKDAQIVAPQFNGQPSAQQNGKPAQNAKQQQNGKPVNKQLNGAEIKHSISHSSLVSEEENDSGLGQISPVSQEKNVAQVADGGFLFASDGLNADQLAKLKAQVAETLKAQGIDPSILASISSSDPTSTARPRNRARKENFGGKSSNKEGKKLGDKGLKS